MIIFLIAFTAVQAHDPNQEVAYDDLAIKTCYGFPKNDWSIHGLWPEYGPEHWPQFCNPSRYGQLTPAAIAPMRLEMDKYWYSCEQNNKYSNWSFWVHEWDKHGTCQPLDVPQFFRRTVDAFYTARENNWYGCCAGQTSQCLIPLNKNTGQFTGKCH